MALGASRSRVVTQLMSESLLTAFVGGLLGLAVARLALLLYRHVMGDETASFWVDVRLDRGVVLFALAITLLATLLAGLLPAWHGARMALGETLKDQSRGSSSLRLGRLNTVLVIVETTLSCGLLIATGLMVESVIKLKTVHLGFDPKTVISGQVSLYGPHYSDPRTQSLYLTTLLERLERKPEVAAVAFGSSFPGVPSQTSYFAIAGTVYAAESSYPETQWVVVSPKYFEVFGLHLVKGRKFVGTDREGSDPVVVVNRSFAQHYFGGQDPIGKRLRFGKTASSRPWLTVLGVVSDLQLGEITGSAMPETVYLPMEQKPRSWMNVFVETRGFSIRTNL
jgi:hypothetical protein